MNYHLPSNMNTLSDARQLPLEAAENTVFSNSTLIHSFTSMIKALWLIYMMHVFILFSYFFILTLVVAYPVMNILEKRILQLIYAEIQKAVFPSNKMYIFVFYYHYMRQNMPLKAIITPVQINQTSRNTGAVPSSNLSSPLLLRVCQVFWRGHVSLHPRHQGSCYGAAAQ